jgi:NADP-dependent 3-hydroxy acid dehydrogenase YdfG/acyl carrier protein
VLPAAADVRAGAGAAPAAALQPLPPVPATAAGPDAAGSGGAGEAAAVGRAVRATLALLQEWLADPRLAGTRLVLYTRGAVAARPGEAADPLGAALWGLVRSAQAEHPDRFVLLDSAADADPAGPLPLAALLVRDEPQLAVRDGVLLAPRLVRVPPPDPAPAPAPWGAGTVLVTGGTGGLGALVARHLVDAHGVRDLLLVSRRGSAADGVDRLRAELTEQGARVTVAAADVAEEAQLDALLAGVPADRPLSAVVHTAGVLADGVLQGLTGEQVDRVLGPKLGAALLLDERTRAAGPVPLVLFSSLAGTVGTAGQAAYAAANAGLDALAERCRAAGRPAVSVAWGRWEQSGGMTAGLGAADTARLGGGLTAAAGLALLDAALTADHPVLVAARLDAAALRAATAAGRLPAVLRGLVPAVRPGTAAGRPDGAAGLRRRLLGTPAGERAGVLLDVVRDHVAAVLGAEPADLADPAGSFQELGLDSLKVVELRNRLADATGLRLPATLAFDLPSPLAVAGLLAERLDPGPDATAPAGPAATGAAPDGPAPTGPAPAGGDLEEQIRTATPEQLRALLQRDLGVRLE